MGKILRILIADDSEDDAELVVRLLKKAGYELHWKRVESAAEFSFFLKEEECDVIVSDYSMAGFNGLEALEILIASQLDIPFILISGQIGEELAVDAMKSGASDYLMKSNLARLVPAVERELREVQTRQLKRHIEQERARLLERLQEAVHARDEFLLIASHELKTPLTSLRLYMRLLRKINNSSDPNSREAAQPVNLEYPPLKEIKRQEIMLGLEKQIDRLLDLVETLLDVSKISAGLLQIQVKEVDLREVVCKAIEILRENVESAQCQIVVHAAMPVIGLWDPIRLRQVVFNLVQNSIKYAMGSSITITVEKLGKDAKLTVQDLGPGISKEDQERIFQRFERAACSNHTSGLGLGLYISGQIIHAHGGAIRLESIPGRGSSFIIELPIRAQSIKAA